MTHVRSILSHAKKKMEFFKALVYFERHNSAKITVRGFEINGFQKHGEVNKPFKITLNLQYGSLNTKLLSILYGNCQDLNFKIRKHTCHAHARTHTFQAFCLIKEYAF